MFMATAIPMDIFELLEKKVGREEAKEVVKIIEETLTIIEKKAQDVALQKKLEIKDELTKELATKADIVRLEGEINTIRQEIQTVKIDLEGKIHSLKVDLEGKLRLYFLILLFTIILVSPKAIDLIRNFLGVVK